MQAIPVGHAGRSRAGVVVPRAGRTGLWRLLTAWAVGPIIAPITLPTRRRRHRRNLDRARGTRRRGYTPRGVAPPRVRTLGTGRTRAILAPRRDRPHKRPGRTNAPACAQPVIRHECRPRALPAIAVRRRRTFTANALVLRTHRPRNARAPIGAPCPDVTRRSHRAVASDRERDKRQRSHQHQAVAVRTNWTAHTYPRELGPYGVTRTPC